MSDTEEPDQPRLVLDDNDSRIDRSRVPDLIRDLYRDVLEVLEVYPTKGAEELLMLVASRWYTTHPVDFWLLLELWSQTDDDPPRIWTEVNSPAKTVMGENPHNVMRTAKHQLRLKPFANLPLDVLSMGGGGGFYGIFEGGDPISHAQFDRLMTALYERDKQLGLLDPAEA